MSIRSSLLLLPALVALTPQTASATCLLQCAATLSNASCADRSGDTYTTQEKIYLYGGCTVTCCAPPNPEDPNGSCSTSTEPLDAAYLSILDEAYDTVPGMFLNVGQTCAAGQNLVVYDRTLAAGSYEVVNDGLTVAELDVEEASPGCWGRKDPVGAGLGSFALIGFLGLWRPRRRVS